MEGTPDVALPPAPQAAAGARRHLREVGSHWPREILDLALLLTSELVTNAVRYGRGTITLSVETTASRLRVEVGDDNPEPVHPREPADYITEGGRGLHIVDALSSRWGMTLRTEPPGKAVWFELRWPSGSGARARPQDLRVN